MSGRVKNLPETTTIMESRRKLIYRRAGFSKFQINIFHNSSKKVPDDSQAIPLKTRDKNNTPFDDKRSVITITLETLSCAPSTNEAKLGTTEEHKSPLTFFTGRSSRRWASQILKNCSINTISVDVDISSTTRAAVGSKYQSINRTIRLWPTITTFTTSLTSI